jgi:hypothetical protein
VRNGRHHFCQLKGFPLPFGPGHIVGKLAGECAIPYAVARVPESLHVGFTCGEDLDDARGCGNPPGCGAGVATVDDKHNIDVWLLVSECRLLCDSLKERIEVEDPGLARIGLEEMVAVVVDVAMASVVHKDECAAALSNGLEN